MRANNSRVTSSSFRLLFFLLILQLVSVLRAQGTSSSLINSSSGCRLPEPWKGKWFQSGVQSPLEIKARSMETKGICYESSGDKFLFVEQTSNCHRCIVINERHPNVLQYKESMYCEDEDTLENLCSRITGDAQLYSLFRLDGTPEDCPFRGAPFTFTYNRGYGECKYPLSRVDSCTENSRLLLRYQACPEVPKTESTAEEMQCIGQWREGSHHYLIAKVQHRLTASFEDSYRCFAFEKIKGVGGATAGYKVAQSGDATCSGVSSPTEGARTLIFTKVEGAAPKCKFPTWFSSHRWHSLDGKQLIRFYHKNTTFHVLDESGSVPKNNKSGVSTAGISNSLIAGSRLSCLNMKETSGGRHVAIQAHYLQGCKSMTLCLHVYKRDHHVIEIQASEVFSSDDNSFACSKAPSLTEGTLQTYINSEASYRRCPHLGKYSASGVVKDGRVVRDVCSGGGNTVGREAAGSFHTVVVGCGDRDTMEFQSSCPNQEQSTVFACHGSWEENGKGFVIASPLSRSSTAARRYCFVYTNSLDGILSVSSSKDSCRRSSSGISEGTWAFNLTVQGPCAESVTSGNPCVLNKCPVSVMIANIFTTLYILVSHRHRLHLWWSSWWFSNKPVSR